jgi:hypothetical protein
MMALTKLFEADDAFAIAVRTCGFSCKGGESDRRWREVRPGETNPFRIKVTPSWSSLRSGLLPSLFFDLETFLLNFPLGLLLISLPLLAFALALTFTLCQRFQVDLRLAR